MGSPTSGSPADASARVAARLRVPRLVIVLGVVSLLNDLSGEMITPLLPLFLVGALAAPVAVVGLVEGAADSTTALLKVWVGHRSDRIRRRKRFIVAGYGLSAIAKPIIAVSLVWPQALAARVLDRAGKGIRGAPRDAAIADATPKELLGRAFGVHRAFDTAGAIGGAVVALLLIVWLAGAAGAVSRDTFQAVFLAASVPGIVSIAILAAAFHESPPPAAPVGEARPRPLGLIASVRVLPPAARRFLVVSSLFAFGNFTLGLFVLRASEFAGGIVPTLLAYIAFNIVATALSFPAGVLADRFGRRSLVAASFALFAAASLSFAIAGSFEQAVLAFLVYGAFFAAWEASYRSYVSEICPKDLRGTALGAQGTVLGILTLPGSAAAGLLWTAYGPQAPFLVGAGVGLAALALFAALGRPAREAAST